MFGDRFMLTQDHITLLQNAYVDWFDCEYGAPTIDPKRPYGNSSVEEDIVRILGWNKKCITCGHDPSQDELSEELRQKAQKIHTETQTALQIILSVGHMTPGEYIQNDKFNRRSWQLVSSLIVDVLLRKCNDAR